MDLTILCTAFWLGLLTAISPCPLATNIAAISFISRKSEKKQYVLFSGLLYSLGRVLAYVILAFIIAGGLLQSAQISRFLQKYMNEALGPILIILGLILLGLIGDAISIQLGGEFFQKKAKTGNVFWSLPLGFIFALSFCPVSAGLFFAGLIPVIIKEGAALLLSVTYGIGTALPVIVFAFIIAFASSYLSKAFSKLSKIELWIRTLTGIIFILAGIYYTLTHIYNITLF